MVILAIAVVSAPQRVSSSSHLLVLALLCSDLPHGASARLRDPQLTAEGTLHGLQDKVMTMMGASLWVPLTLTSGHYHPLH